MKINQKQLANNETTLSQFSDFINHSKSSAVVVPKEVSRAKSSTGVRERLYTAKSRTSQHRQDLTVVGDTRAVKCSHAQCDRLAFKQGICKHHYCNQVQQVLRREFKNIFRNTDKAYSSLDFTGKGFITEEDFLSSLLMTRIPYSREDVKLYFKQSNLFSTAGTNTGGISFDLFKKTFFPQFSQVTDEVQSDEERQMKQNQKDMKMNKEKQPEIIQERLKKLERILKDKFSNNWESVRKAFLALDGDYDGFITVEDILRHFGQEKDLNYNDLKKLIKDKDSRKVGKIGYTDFSKWVGNSIHQSEGFYFRHDSIKNPQFDKNLEKNENNQNQKGTKLAQETLIKQNLEKTVLDKIQFQWKTLRKAFMDLNMEKSGSILPEELRFYFKHWGLTLTDDQFQFLFDKFDLDKDGKISYKDFQMTVGSEIHPAEGLYFRQDKPQQMKITCCKHDKCWQTTSGAANFCELHQKMHQDQCVQLFQKMFKQISPKWKKFISTIKREADPEDKDQIFYDTFVDVLKRFGIVLREEDLTNLKDSFPGRDEGSQKRINIARIYDQKYNQMLSTLYKKIDVHENDGQDDPVDQSGYIGQFYRLKKPLTSITESELVQIIAKNNKMSELVRTIKEIDQQRNGFVTSTELDDILKIIYKEELGSRDLKPLLKPYASIQNRILIDYKAFRDSLVKQLKLINSSATFTDTAVSSPQKFGGFEERASQRAFSSLHAKPKSSMGRTPSKAATPMEMREDKAAKIEENQMIQIKELIRPQTRDVIRRNNRDGGSRLKTMGVVNPNLHQTLDCKVDVDGFNFESPRNASTVKAKLMQSLTAGKQGMDNSYFDSTRLVKDSEERMEGFGVGRNLLSNLKKRNSVQSSNGARLNHSSMNVSSNQLEKPVDLQRVNHFAVQKRSAASVNFGKGMYNTISQVSALSVQEQKGKEVLKMKLQYEWRKIYRLLNIQDKESIGFVSKEEFEAICHQCGAFLSKEDMNKIMALYSSGSSRINYQKLSVELGLHTSAFRFMKSSQSRMQTVERLRNIYSSSEKKQMYTTLNNCSTATTDNNQGGAKYHSPEEVKGILLSKIKKFRDLIHLYQKKNNCEHAILPLGEFKSVLRGTGLNIQTEQLHKFIVNRQAEGGYFKDLASSGKKGERSKSSYGSYSTAAAVKGTGVDAREFLKFYL